MLLKLCDSEVEDLDRVAATLVRLEPDVVRFQISVNNTLLVGFLHGRANLLEDVECPSNGEILLLFQDLTERAAVEIFHGEISGSTIRSFGEAEVRYVDDVGMAETAGSARFTAKPFDEFGTLHELRSDNFDRDGSLGAQMGREIHGPHAAASKLAFDFVFAVERLTYKIRKIHKIRIPILFDLPCTTLSAVRFSLFAAITSNLTGFKPEV